MTSPIPYQNELDRLMSSPPLGKDSTDDNSSSELRRLQAQPDTALRQSMDQARLTTPDAHARVVRLQLKTGLPADLISRNLDQVEQEAAKQGFDPKTFREKSPLVAQWMQDPNNAAVAHDDTEHLSALERLFGVKIGSNDIMPISILPTGKPGTVEQNYRTGLAQLEQAQIGIRMMQGSATPADTARLAELQKMPAAETAGGAYKALEGTAQILPGMIHGWGMGARLGLGSAAVVGGTAAVMGLPTGPGEALVVPTAAGTAGAAGFRIGMAQSTFMQEAGSAYIDYRQRGIDHEHARQAAFVVGVVNAGIEQGALEVLAHRMPWLRKLMTGGAEAPLARALTQRTFGAAAKTFALNTGAALATEVTEEVTQEIGTITGTLVAEQLSHVTGDQEMTPGAIADRLLDTAKQTAISMALLAPMGTGGTFVEDLGRASAAQRNTQIIEAMGETAKASKLRERLPEKFREFVAKVRENGTVDNVHIDAEQFTQYFQSQGMDPAAVAAQVTGDVGQYFEAMDRGGDLVIPLENYATQLAPTDHHSALAQDIRLHQGDLSAREAKVVMKEAQAQLDEMVQTEAEKGPATTEQKDAQESIKQQLIATGETEQAAETKAAVIAAFQRVMSLRTGVPVAEQFPVTVGREGVDGGTTLQQGADQTQSPEFQAWFGKSQVVDAEGKPLVVYHGTPKSGFAAFDASRGAFFTDKTKLADQYTMQRGPWMSHGDAPGVYPVHLSLQNPLVIEAHGKQWDNLPVPWKEWKPKVFGALPDGAVSTEAALDYARENGYDGIIIRNVQDSPWQGDRTKGTVYAVVDPTQAKSVFNRGTFDPTDPNILHQAERKVGSAALGVERGERQVAEKTRVSADEQKAIRATASLTGQSLKDVEATVRKIKAAYPSSDGWAQPVFLGASIETDAEGNKGKIEYRWQTISYSFNTVADKTLKPGTPEYDTHVSNVAQRMTEEVRGIQQRALEGDKAAQQIIRQADWYKNMRLRLRQEFGGLGDLFADMLGATSPNTPVRENWKNALDALRKATRGEFDQLMPQWVEWADKVDQAELEFRAWFDEELAKKKTKAAVKETAQWKKRKDELAKLRALPEEFLPLKDSGKKYGFNGRNITRALVHLWRVVKNADPDIGRGGTAPKALNFSGNLIGFRTGATIDVWAARMLQRLAGMSRVPTIAESGVSGEMLESGQTTLQFGFGQDVFHRASTMIRQDAQMAADPRLATLGDDDLQALVWFIEKELWTRNDWTSSQGEGGSFEFEADLSGSPEQSRIAELRKVIDSRLSSTEDRVKAAAELATLHRSVDRYHGGISIQQSKETQGRDFTPDDAAQSVVANALKMAVLRSDPGKVQVLGLKAFSTEGRYWGATERAIDLEAIVRGDFDPTPMWLEVLQQALASNQDAVFLSRVLRPEEEVDPTRHRPGVEVYFREPTALAQAEPKLAALTQWLEAQGEGGFTVVVDSRPTAEAQGGAMDRVVGVRFQYIPEFEERYTGSLSVLQDVQLADRMRERSTAMQKMADRLMKEVDGVSFAGLFHYDTRVAFSHEYDQEIRNAQPAGVAAGEPAAHGGGAWEGRSVREGVAAAGTQSRVAAERAAQRDARDAAHRDATDAAREAAARELTTLLQRSPNQKGSLRGYGEIVSGEGRGPDSSAAQAAALDNAGEVQGTFAAPTHLTAEVSREVPVKAKDPDVVAAVMARLGRGAVERVEGLVTDSKGKPLAIIGGFKGDIASAVAPTSVFIAEAFRIQGAAHLWVAHNHPSGSPQLSGADRSVSRELREAFRGSGIQYHGIFAIGDADEQGRRSYWFNDGAADEFNGVSTVPSGKTIAIPAIEREMARQGTLPFPGINPVVRDPTSAMNAAEALSGGEPGILLLSSAGKPVAFIPVDPSIAGWLRTDKRMDGIYRALSVGNGATAIIVTAGKLKPVQARNLAGLVDQAQVPVVDVIDRKPTSMGSEPVSWAQMGRDLSTRDFQQQNRGMIQFGKQGTGPRPFNITLLANADESTFLHESGHYFLEVFSGLAQSTQDPKLAADMQTIRTWLGNDGSEFTVAQHEQWARGVEAYLMEGKSPSNELRAVFARFKVWLTQLYRSLSGLNVTLSPEIRGVMDRMLASDEEIRRAEAKQGYAPLFASAEDAGMTQAEFEAYTRNQQRATDAGAAELLHDMLQETRKESQAWWKKEKDLTTTAVTAELHADPAWQAITYLKHGTMLSGDPLEGEPVKLSKEVILDRYGPMELAQLRGLYSAEGGADPDAVAPLFGFASGDLMITALIEKQGQTLTSAIKAEVDRRMDIAHPDLKGDSARLAQVAQDAIHAGGERANVLLTELRALGRQTGMRVPPDIHALRETAQQTIAQKTVREIQPFPYQVAEAKAAKQAEEAYKAGDFARAASWKRKQLLNHLLYRAAKEAKEADQNSAEYLKSFTQDKARARLGLAGPQYLDQVDRMLERFDFSKQTNVALDKRASLAEWISEQEDMGLVPAISGALRNEAFTKNYRDLTHEELGALRDAVKNIAHLASLKRKLIALADGREFGAVRDELVDGIVLNGGEAKPQRIGDLTPSERRAEEAGAWFASLRKIGSIVRELDGQKDNGPMFRLFLRQLNEAQSHEATMLNQAGTAYAALWEKYFDRSEAKEMGRKRTQVPGSPLRLTHWDRLMIALNTGNEDNKTKLLDGYNNLDEPTLKAVLDQLEQRDWEFVQGVWDMIDAYWPAIKAKQERITGLAPEKVGALPIDTKFGAYRGGYFPLRYDDRQSPKAYAFSVESEAKDLMRGAVTKATTRRGHTEARVEGVRMPVLLSPSVITSHLNTVIHDLTHHEVLIDANRLLRDSQVAKAILDHYGHQTYRAMQNVLTSLAAGSVGAMKPGERYVGYLRTGSTTALLGWNLTTSLLQGFGLSNSIVRVGAKWVGHGLAQWVRSGPKGQEGTLEWIRSKSEFMANRAKTTQRDLREMQTQIATPGRFTDLKASYFGLIGKAQLFADVPTWLGAYQKASHEFPNATEAEWVALADQAVKDSQGGGMLVDLSAIESGGPYQKLFTTFYSYGSTVLQQNIELGKRTQWKKPKSVGAFLVDALILNVLPVVAASLVTGALRGEPPDPEGMPDDVLASLMNQIPYLREASGMVPELTSIFTGEHGHGRAYEGPAGLRVIPQTGKLAQQIAQGELDAAFWKALNMEAGLLLHYPALQLQRTYEGADMLWSGQTVNPAVLLVGPPRKR